MKKNFQVFLSFSFEKETVDGISNHEIGMVIKKKLESLFKKNHLSVDIKHADRPYMDEPETIIKQIQHYISTSDISICVYSKTKDNKFATWVDQEFGYALGHYSYYSGRKNVFALREDSIRVGQLGFLSMKDLHVPKFTRNDKRSIRRAVEELFNTIYNHILDSGPVLPVFPFRQLSLEKTITIYTTGHIIGRNRFRMLILNGDQFKNQQKQRITHYLWIEEGTLPPFTEMCRTPIEKRFNSSIFTYDFIRIGEPLYPYRIGILENINVLNDNDKDKAFEIIIPQEVKTRDIIEYEYAWSCPKSVLQNGGYVNLKAHRGLMDNATLTLRFERRTINNKIKKYLDRPPQLYISPIYTAPIIKSNYRHIGQMDPQSEEIWYDTYTWQTRSFDGIVSARWGDAILPEEDY